ncbi:MAG: leucine-rich repeat domain-containing protein [Clostridia bacterium]|nr:leucine-rich repeat domain-containing protein [Clostridia bacterium]
MVSFKKAMALKTPEEVGKLSPEERKEYESQIQQEYKIKVHTLSGCCKKFEEYLEKTTDEPRNWHEKFKEIFSEYLNSKKHFSRTNSMIKDMYKKLSKAKYNWTKSEYYQNIFKFKAEKANKKGYIKRSAIDDKGVANIFNVSIPKAISDVFNRHKTLQNSQKGKLDAYSAVIVSKYLNSAQDMKNLEATNSNFKENSEKFKYNPVPLTKENRKAFENIETQYVYSTEDKIFTDGKIKKIHFVDANITVDVKDIGKKYNTRPLSKLNRWLLYKNIETQFIYSAEDPIYNDGKIKNHVICIKGKIPGYAFSHNPKLKEVTIQSGVETIGEEAFRDCTSLEKITIPNSVNKIEHEVFADCTSLKEVTIQSGVKEIGVYAFYSCTSLKEVTIPSSVIKIEKMLFLVAQV